MTDFGGDKKDLTQEQKDENQESIEELREKYETIKRQYSGTSQEALKLKEVTKVYKDNKHILELHKKNPELAEQILKEEWGISFEEAKEKL